MRETWVKKKGKGVRYRVRVQRKVCVCVSQEGKNRTVQRKRIKGERGGVYRSNDARAIPCTTHPRSVGASLAHKLILVELGDAKEAANVTDVDRVRVRHLKEAFAQKLGRAVGDHAITLHFAETEATVSRAPLKRKEGRKRNNRDQHRKERAAPFVGGG